MEVGLLSRKPCRSPAEVTHPPDLILASDVFYDVENRPLLEAFPRPAPSVLVADARVRIDEVSSYRKICEMEAVTLPELGEAEDFGRVGFYTAGDEDLPAVSRPSAPARVFVPIGGRPSM